MKPLHELLAAFYERAGPRGVAFVGPPRLACSFGRPAEVFSWSWENGEGFIQYHLEASDASVYVSTFGWGKCLIAQFPFQEEYPPPPRPWLAFVRLASAVALILENPDEAVDSGTAGVVVPRPYPAPQLTRAAAVALPSDAG